MHYLIWEAETAPTTGMKHIQGYVRLKDRTRLNGVKTLLQNNTLHLEPSKGSEQENKEYCSKEREGSLDWAEHGDYIPTMRQGCRTDLQEITDEILNGTPLEEIASSHPVEWVKFHTGLTSLKMNITKCPPLKRTVRTIVLWGATGVGKTHRCLMNYPEATVISAGRDPFGNYKDEEAILFDEFNDMEWPIREMNRYLDCWRCKLNCRYHDKYAYWNTVLICSNIDPARWYPMTEEPLRAAFFRRITEIIHVVNKEQIIQLKTIIDILNN